MTPNVSTFKQLATLSVFLGLNSVEAQQWQIKDNSLKQVQAQDSSGSTPSILKYDSQNWFTFPCDNHLESRFLWSTLGIGSIGESHTVLLVDRFGKRLGSGTTISPNGYVPVIFVQMKSSSRSLPEGYKDKWIYAVICFPARSEIERQKVIKIVSEGQQGGDVESALVIPVRWDADAEKFKIGLGLLQDAFDLKIREIQENGDRHDQ